MRLRPRDPSSRASLLSFFLLVASLFLPTAVAAHVLREPGTGLPVTGDPPEKPRLGVSASERVRFLVDNATQLKLRLGDTWDVELGRRRTTDDFRNRWYSPQLGRFVTRDPLGYPDGPNAYGAFGGDPVNLSDPMGTLAIEVTPEGAETKSDAYEWALLDQAGYSDSFKYGVVQQYSQEWDTVRGRAALMTSGYQAEAGLRQAGKMWLVGAGAAATGGLAGAGLTAAGMTTTTWGGTLLLGAGSGAAGGIGAQATSDLIDGEFSGVEAYGWSAAGGGLFGLGGAAAVRGFSGVPLGTPSVSTLDLSSVEWGPASTTIAPPSRQRVPNPYGKLGSPAHRAKVAELRQAILERGLIPEEEVRFLTVNGQKPVRYVDIVARDPATREIVEVHQVGRVLRSNPRIPVARERAALRDLRRTPELRGARRKFHPY